MNPTPQPQPYPYGYPVPPSQPYPNGYPAPYPMPQAPPVKVHPVPAGRIVPAVWLMTMVVLAVGSIALALVGALTQHAAPAVLGTVVYSGSLASDDGAWNLSVNTTTQCHYQNGALHATSSVDGTLTPACALNRPDTSDLRLSVTLLPQAALISPSATVAAVIYIHSSVAFVFNATGSYAVYTPQQQYPVYIGSTDQSHDSGLVGNTVVIQAQGATYTLGMNGAQIYQGDFNGAAEHFATSGKVGLGTLDSSTEAAYTDFSLTTP